jgi:hypothetical protein
MEVVILEPYTSLPLLLRPRSSPFRIIASLLASLSRLLIDRTPTLDKQIEEKLLVPLLFFLKLRADVVLPTSFGVAEPVVQVYEELSRRRVVISVVSLGDTLRTGCDALRLVLLKDERHG